MAAVTTAPGLPTSHRHHKSESLNTMPDPCSRNATPTLSRSNSRSPHHPDLGGEVATLSDKLIVAINHQTNLEDSLAAARHELDCTKQRERQLELVVQEHEDLMAMGHLVKKCDVQDEKTQLMSRIAEERRYRETAEKEKRKIEQEVEQLTTALFEEANQMVAVARKERESADRRNEQLRAQLNDTELLLASHQEQLAELKTVMQQMSSDHDEPESITNASTAPTTPAMQNQEHFNKLFEAMHLSPNTPGFEGVLPAPPTTFTHLLHPVLRTDLQSCEDFHLLLHIPRGSAPTSRNTSGTYNGLNVMGLSGPAMNRDSPSPSPHLPSNGSTASLSNGGASSPIPSNHASPNSSFSSRDPSSSSASLKETRFYKRALVEDIEPTLRLDTAPGLSWLARRSVINSMCEGSLIVEPMPAAAKRYIFSCSLCGENRKGDDYVRTHRFRTSDNENAQRYPLCNYCLNRIRAACDFLSFLRLVRDGHWRTDGVEAEKAAWEECVRLRERMFWARVGGGVVPAFLNARDSPRPSVEGTMQQNGTETVVSPNNALGIHTHTTDESSFHSQDQKASIESTTISHPREIEDKEKLGSIDAFAENADIHPPSKDEASDQLRNELRESSRVMASEYQRPPSSASSKVEQKRLSVTIPGAFED